MHMISMRLESVAVCLESKERGYRGGAGQNGIGTIPM